MNVKMGSSRLAVTANNALLIARCVTEILMIVFSAPNAYLVTMNSTTMSLQLVDSFVGMALLLITLVIMRLPLP